jgi:predicted DsbA family dithiol-disulfide isomerase
MRIDIWSDVVCPWCYIGKRRLETALATLPSTNRVEVIHRSFQLNPAAPMASTSRRRDMLMAKYRLSADEVVALDATMERTAAAEGLGFRLTADALTGNTAHAHAIVHLGGAHGKQDVVIERLFRAYFSEQRSVFDDESLVELAIDTGLEADEARRVLRDETYGAAVEADREEARRLGVTGVPFFVIDGRYGVSGAQSVDVFVEALNRAASTHATSPQSPTSAHETPSTKHRQ